MVAFNKLYYREKGFGTGSDKESFDFVQNGNANIQMFMNALKSEKVKCTRKDFIAFHAFCCRIWIISCWNVQRVKATRVSSYTLGFTLYWCNPSKSWTMCRRICPKWTFVREAIFIQLNQTLLLEASCNFKGKSVNHAVYWIFHIPRTSRPNHSYNFRWQMDVFLCDVDNTQFAHQPI